LLKKDAEAAKRFEFLIVNILDMFGGRVLQQAGSSFRRLVPLFM